MRANFVEPLFNEEIIMRTFKHFTSSAISMMLLTSFIHSASASELIDVYGKANVSLQSADEGDGSFSELKSNASRFGVKGEESLENGMTVFYQFEWQVDLADISGSDNIKSRNQFVGLKGDFGKVMLGRHDTVTKSLSKPVDIFSDYEADLKGLWKGEKRVSDSVTYYSPSMSGFTVAMTWVTEEDPEGDNATSIGVYYGDPKLKKSKLYFAVTQDNDIADYDTQRVVVSGKIDKWQLGAALHRQEPAEGGESKSGATFNAQYSINSWKLKSQYQSLEDDNSISVGADYKLGKNTKLYSWYTRRDIDEGDDKRWLSVGVEHKF